MLSRRALSTHRQTQQCVSLTGIAQQSSATGGQEWSRGKMALEGKWSKTDGDGQPIKAGFRCRRNFQVNPSTSDIRSLGIQWRDEGDGTWVAGVLLPSYRAELQPQRRLPFLWRKKSAVIMSIPINCANEIIRGWSGRRNRMKRWVKALGFPHTHQLISQDHMSWKRKSSC